MIKQAVQEGYVAGAGNVYGSLRKRSVRTIIDKPGNYCLTSNFHVDGQYWPVTQEGSKLFSDDDRILLFSASNITLDFKGNKATSDANLLSGLSILLPKDESGWDLPTKQNDLPKNIRITNGYIRLDRAGIAINFRGPMLESYESSDFDGYKPEEFAADMKPGEYAKFVGKPDEIIARVREIDALRARFRQSIPNNPAGYVKRDILIDKMDVLSPGKAIVVTGGSTVIKDSVIETLSGTAIWLHGPNAVIENNTIIVHCLMGNRDAYDGLLPTCKDMDAPIRLMHGDGAIIRNNRFILKDKAHQRIISVFETGAFTFENNTIVGLNDLKDTAKAYTGTLQMKGSGNRIDNSTWSKVMSWFGL